MILENWIIELFGVSAVGKTTLLRAFLRVTDEPWLRREDLEMRQAGRPHALHEELLLRKGRWILAQTDMPISRRAERVTRLSRILNNDIIARDALPKSSFVDEGIAHHFGGFLLTLPKERMTSITRFLNTYAFVHLTGDADHILYRAHMRLKDNPNCGTYGSFRDDANIIRYIECSIQNHKKLAEFAIQLTCPILTLNIENSTSEHLRALRDFIGNLSNDTSNAASID